MVVANANERLLEFNPSQRDAVYNESKRFLLLAGAGTGKTETLTERVVHFIQEKQVNPNRVVMFTYTNKAAGNMGQRIQRKLGYPQLGLISGTFHSNCYRLLREHVYALDILPPRQVVAEHHAAKLRREAGQLLLDREPAAETLLRRFQFSAESLLELYERKKKLNLTVKLFGSKPNPELEEQMPEVLRLAEAMAADYQKLKEKYRVVDFNDILFQFYWVLQNYDAVRDRIRHLHRHIYVDEYQDTNRIQVEILKLILDEASHLTVVGDDTQSIYSFQGSEVYSIRNFHMDFPGATMGVLNENYLSSPPIVAYTNEINATCVGALPKTLVSRGPQIMIRPRSAFFEQAEQEAEWVVNEIQRLMAVEKVPAHEIAILTRIGSVAQTVESALQAAGIAYSRAGGIKFTDLKHIQFFVTFLELLENPKNWLAWETLLPMVPNIGDHFTEVIIRDLQANEGNWSWEQPPVFSIGRGKRLESVMNFWTEMLHAAQVPKQEHVRDYLEEVLPDFRNIYARYYYGTSKMIQLAGPNELPESMEEHIQDINDYIITLSTSYIGLVKDFIDQVVVSQDEKEIRKGITLSTIHSAKGLEWQAVFVIGMTENVLPSRGFGIELNDLEEERRLFYVACTRAKAYLSLSAALRYPRVKGDVSRFAKDSRTRAHLEPLRSLSDNPFRSVNPQLFTDYVLRIPPEPEIPVVPPEVEVATSHENEPF